MKKAFSPPWLARAAANHLIALALPFLALPGLLSAQTLEHRYSFTSDASDSVGGADGTLMGSATVSNGALQLPGGSASAGNYLQLPHGILLGDNSMTVEAWLTDNGGVTWAEAWCFGGATSGPNSGGQQTNYISFIPTSGVNPPDMRAAFKINNEQDVIRPATTLPLNVEEYVVVTYNSANSNAVMYLNGVAVATNNAVTVTPASLGDTYNNYLGLDEYNDNLFKGSVDELRIWNAAVTPVYLAVSTAAGPNVVITNSTPQLLTISVNTNLVGAQVVQANVVGNFDQISNVTVSGVATWTSSKPGVLSVSSSGLVTAVSGGTATISATVNGVTATSQPITVALTSPTISQQPSSVTLFVGETATFSVVAVGGDLTYQWNFGSTAIPGATNSTLVLTDVSADEAGTYSVTVANTLGSLPSSPATLTINAPTLKHRYSFNTDANDSVGGANATLMGGTYLANNTVVFPGGAASAGNYVQLPNGILVGDNSLTVETWLTDTTANSWAEPWSFGGATSGTNSGNGQTNYIGYVPSSPSGDMRAAFKINSEQDVIATGDPLPLNVEEYAVLTYDAPSTTATLYLNGVQVAVNHNITVTPASLGNTYNNYLGLDQFNDALFQGSIDELRIWNAAVSPLYLAVSAAAGPDVLVTDLTPQSVSVTVTNSSLLGGQTEQAVALGVFPGAANVTLSSFVTNWTSSNPAVLTVNSTGVITAVGVGSATVSATVFGTIGTSPAITVPEVAPTITEQPDTSATILIGGTFHSSAEYLGVGPLTYSWYFNDNSQPIAGATESTLTITNVQLTNAGNYTLIIGNQYGSVTSSVESLTVISPTIYEQELEALHPIAFWPLNETSGTTAYDVIGGYNGTYEADESIEQPGPTNAIFGTNSYSAYFDGDAYVDIPVGPFNITGAITISTWVNLPSPPTFSDIVGHSDNSWRISVNGAAGQPGANDGGPPADATSPTSIVGSNWVSVVYTYNGTLEGNNGSLYVNGELVANNAISTVPAGTNLDVWIGGAPDYGDVYNSVPAPRLFQGYIADVAIFTQALTAEQVEGLYTGQVNVGITRSGSNVVITWPLGVLLESPTVNGPWTVNSAAVSPYTVPATSGDEFYKVQFDP